MRGGVCVCGVERAGGVEVVVEGLVGRLAAALQVTGLREVWERWEVGKVGGAEMKAISDWTRGRKRGEKRWWNTGQCRAEGRGLERGR